MTNKLLFFLFVVVHGVFSTLQETRVVPSYRNDSEIAGAETTAALRNSSVTVLSRKRRYVVFPKGSSMQFVYCETQRTYTPLTKRFKIGFTMGLAWMLPSEAHELYLQKRDVDATAAAAAAAALGIRHRADLYKILEGFLSLKGLKGRECIMRAVCEASETKTQQNNSEVTSDKFCQGTFMEELHKLLFALPQDSKHKTPYDNAREEVGKCGETYGQCHSFLDLVI